MSKKPKGLSTTYQVRLYPTSAQSGLLMAHCREYIAVVNVLASAYDAEIMPKDASTKDFRAALPSAVKNQALRDAASVYQRACERGVLPVLKKPLCQWNNQNWRLVCADTGNKAHGILTVPVTLAGKTQQIEIACAPVVLAGLPGLLRIKKKRGKWIADVTMTLALPEPSRKPGVMGIDLGIKVPAVVHIAGAGTRFFGNGRYQRFMRRRFYSQRKQLQKAKKPRALKKNTGRESRWMKEVNHQLSRQIVNHAQEQGVGTIKVEALAGIRTGTTRTSRGAHARKNNRMHNSWSFFQLTAFISYKAERVGIKVEQVDPAYTSKHCPACGTRNTAQDRAYVCAACGWKGHRDTVGAVNISRRAGLSDQRRGATGA